MNVSSNKIFKLDWGKRFRNFLPRVPCIFLPFYCLLISRLMYLSRCNTTVRTVELNSRNVFVHWVKRCAVHACPYIAEICKGNSMGKNLNCTSSFSHWVGFMVQLTATPMSFFYCTGNKTRLNLKTRRHSIPCTLISSNSPAQLEYILYGIISDQ
jgi:hypothetical protein